MLMRQSGALDAFGEGQSPAPIVPGMFLERKCQQWHLGLRGDRRARASAWEEEARKSRSLADGGMGSILSLSLGDSGMKQLNPRNALLLPQAK